MLQKLNMKDAPTHKKSGEMNLCGKKQVTRLDSAHLLSA